jgi:CRISPR-associated protein Csc3
VGALTEGPLALFYTAEKLLEARARAGQQAEGGLITWLSQQAFPHAEALALSKGGIRMTKLSEELQRLAEIAWQNGLRGRSLEKSSLLFPLAEVFQKLGHPGGAADREALMAGATMDIFDHLSRIADQQYKPGRRKWEASKAFVDAFFSGVLDGVYSGNVRKLLADEKLLRSAFLFYVREQIPRKEVPEEVETEEEE